ncbi:aspartate aminotransferase family protein [Arthrobacter sp. FW306-2-2C-D06B]|uniref:aspartate aminotransferase family protein n=1 Tax=Arthrobacter sp. FW306-2-2C-D06B TaxID=2879618 RepID=UPI001F010E5E|nr:aspartate aminotransferase family protein [Arthrobacter sp. FW306-2-2C-D06B]UKA60510.1 aspartate aminotransferase family protein [Arthrobacter sp. FW306-2-2C-D06B]
MMTETLRTESLPTLQAAAHRHLWMHFADMSSYEDREIPTVVKGEGAYVWDDRGRRYIDGLASLYCVNAGHGRREIADAVHNQLKDLEYFPVWNYATPPAVKLAERVAELAPGNLNRVFFTSGGSESVESAWKLARQYHRLRGHEGKTKIIGRTGAYHGTTMGALSITGIPSMQEPFLPLVPGVLHAPKVDNYRATVGPEQHALDCANAVADIIKAEGANTIAAIIVEPVQNSGGCLPADPIYFQRLREICDANDVLLISDETICAWGRTGAFFGSAALGYQPDIITTAKAITSAYIPMGAVIAGDHVVEPFLSRGAVFEHGLTFGGHPVAAAAGLANIEIIENENLCGRATELGARLRAGLEGLYDIPIVGDVRGAGFFQAIELVKDQKTKESLPAETLLKWSREVPGMLFDRGLVCRAIHRGAPIIQFAPTLVSSEQDVDDIVSIVDDVLRIKLAELG